MALSSMVCEDVIGNFVAQARKMIQCNLCHELLKNPVCLKGCQHCFCHYCLGICLKSRNPSVNMLQCPICKAPMKEDCMETSEKMDKIVKTVVKFISDCYEETGLDKGNFLEGMKPFIAARPCDGQPATQSFPQQPPVVHNTPEPQQKVHQWLENAIGSPSMVINETETEDEIFSSNSAFKTPNGKATTSSKASSLGKDSFLELRSSSLPCLRSSGKRGRGGRRGRPSKKNPLTIRSVEKAAPTSEPSTTASTLIAKQLFVSQPSNNDELVSRQNPDINTQSHAENVRMNESVEKSLELTRHVSDNNSKEDIRNQSQQDERGVQNISEVIYSEERKINGDSPEIIQKLLSKALPKPASPLAIVSETVMTLNSSTNEDQVMSEVLPIAPTIVHPVSDKLEPDIFEKTNALSEFSLPSPSVDVVNDQGMEGHIHHEHSQQRLTFSIPVETQDLIELRGPLIDTEDIFNAIVENKEKGKESARSNVVRFLLHGSIIPKKVFTKTRNAVSFKLMGKLDFMKKLSPEIRQTQLEERIDSPLLHFRNSFVNLEHCRPPVENKETQTVPQIVMKNSETQTEPNQLYTSVETQTINLHTQSSVNTQTSSLTHLPESEDIPTSEITLPDDVKVVPVQPEPSKIPKSASSSTNVVRMESDDSNGVEFFSAQPSSKRARQLSSSSDTEDSQDAKRRRSTALKVKVRFPTLVRKSSQEDQVAVCHPISNIPSTPTIRVLESDPEDMLSATPRKKPERKRMSVQRKIFVCSSLPRSQLKLVEELAQILGAEIIPTFNKTVTHVIVRTDEDNVAERTLKFLYGVAAKKWVVNIDWVRQSIAEKRAVPEEGFEAMDMDGEPGPSRSRCAGSTPLFNDFEFCCIEPFTDVSVAQLRELLELCGATTVPSPFALTRRSCCSIIVVQSDTGFDVRKADMWADQHKAITVSREWILDSIATHTLFPLKEHLIGRKSEALLKTMGVPKSLLE